MKVLRIEQNSDEWRQWRLGKITGSKSKSIKPLSRGTDRTPQGIWQLLAEKIADNSGGEAPLDRGHRLENEALQVLAERFELDIDINPGVWVSDLDDDIAISPDGAERKAIPTWAAEAKCLSSANHLKYIYYDLIARTKADYNPLNSIPDDAKDKFKDQVIQYFAVNEQLEKLYFVLYDDRIDPAVGDWQFHVITVNRSDVGDLADEQRQSQQAVLAMINQLIAAMTEHGLSNDFGYRAPEKIKEVK